MDFRRWSVLITIAIFMIVTVAHVAVYAGQYEPDGWRFLGVLYALGVEASIAICAYFTAWATTRRWAWIGFVLFTVASGVMNWGYIEPATFHGWVYALFPTAAIALSGFLYRQVDVLTKYRHHSPDKARKPKTKLPELPEVETEIKTELPQGLKRIPRNLADFRNMVTNGEANSETLTGNDLARIKGFSDRQGRNWLNEVKNGTGKK